MAKTKQFNIDQFKTEATRPLYAAVGVTDLAVEFARIYAADVQDRVAKVDLEPKALRDQARTIVGSRMDELQAEAKALPAKLEAYLNDNVAEVNETYSELATRGQKLVGRILNQQATQDTQAAAKTTTAKAKTTRTQTAKSASGSAATTKTAAKKTAGTAKRNVKATSTAAKKTASAGAKATTDAADKVGN